MKSIKIKSSAERADELRRDPAAYFASVRAEVQRNTERAGRSRNPEPTEPRQGWFARLLKRVRRG